MRLPRDLSGKEMPLPHGYRRDLSGDWKEGMVEEELSY